MRLAFSGGRMTVSAVMHEPLEPAQSQEASVHSSRPTAADLCFGCVYYPPNLPETAYSAEDYAWLRQKTCSFDFHPSDENCTATRKTSCSLLDLELTTRCNAAK